jgi:hypothetical protein
VTAPPSRPRKTPRTAARRWLARFAIALVVGLAIGGGSGVFVVNKLEPGRPNSIDSVQALLDSITRGRIAPVDSGRKTQAAPAPLPNPDTAVAPDAPASVPTLVDLEEGAARNAIRDAGLQVGEVKFQASTKPAGTVIGTVPDAGTAVVRNSAVALVLSDGRPPTDTLSRFDSRP